MDVGALIKEAVAEKHFRSVDEENPLIRTEPIILNALNVRFPSARGTKHDFGEAIVAVLLNEIQQLEIAGSGAGKAHVSAPDGRSLRSFLSSWCQPHFEDDVLGGVIVVAAHSDDVLVEQARTLVCVPF